MSPPQPSSKLVFLRVRFLDPSFSLPSSPPFNLSPASSMLINNNMRMIPKFSSLYRKVTPRTGLSRLETALVHLTSWFYHNGLALNPEKSEAILLGTHPRNKSLDNITQVDVNGSPIPISDSIKATGRYHRFISCFQQTCEPDMPVLSVPHPSSSPHSSHPRCQHRQTGWTRVGELPT